MKRIFDLILLLLPLTLSAAITEKYVSAAGGGAHDGSTASDAFSWAEMITDINAGGKAGNRYNFTGTAARTTTADTISGSGSATSPIIIRGYASTIGDGYLGRATGGSGALSTANMLGIVTYTTGSLTVSGADIIFESVKFTGTRNGAFVAFSGGQITARSCYFSDASSGTSGLCITASGSACTLADCDFTVTNGGGVGQACISASGTRIMGCRIGPSSSAGITIGGVGGFINGCQIFNAATVGITNTSTLGAQTVVGNTITGCVDGIGNVASSTVLQVYVNNCITDNSGNGINANSGMIVLANNRFRNNGTDVANAADWTSASNWGVISGGSTSDYVNAGASDYRLIPTSPARKVGLLPSRDIGGIQSAPGVPSSVFIH